MFVGHYAASLALKRLDRRASLGLLFLAVQFLDLLFFPLAMLGIERFNLLAHATPSTHFELVYMPWSHSLVAAIGWSLLAYGLFRWGLIKRQKLALVVAVAVFSHWIFDLVVHTPDLPLWSDASPKVGLGLWNHPILTWALESVLLLAGLWIYLRATTAVSTMGRYGMTVFVVLLMALNVMNLFGPLQGDSKSALALTALVSYAALAGAAFWLDRHRR